MRGAKILACDLILILAKVVLLVRREIPCTRVYARNRNLSAKCDIPDHICSNPCVQSTCKNSYPGGAKSFARPLVFHQGLRLREGRSAIFWGSRKRLINRILDLKQDFFRRTLIQDIRTDSK